MVRLGLLSLVHQHDARLAFNPTVVRLGREPAEVGQPLPLLLSIPLWCDWDAKPNGRVRCPSRLSIPLWCDWDAAGVPTTAAGGHTFNPTVVRLGLGTAQLYAQLSLSFNPTVVRLGPLPTGVFDRIPPAFNPTVVRLGHHVPGRRRPHAGRFQSHCGAIGTGASSTGLASVIFFQSHCGAIGTGPQRCR